MFDMKGPNANKLGYKKTKIGVIPDTWDIKTCSDVAAEQRNAMVGGPFGSDLVSADYVSKGVPVIRGQNMGRRFLSGSYVYVTEKKAESLKANLARPGDIVFTQRGTLGQVSLVPEMPFSSYLISQSQMKLTVNRAIADVLFLFYVFSSENQQAFIRVETIQTGVPHINLGILRRVPVQIPPLPEQKKIADILSTCDAAIEQLSELISAKKRQKKALMQQLLTGKKRFKGFRAKWKTVMLNEICTRVRGVAEDPGAHPVLSITAGKGFVSQEDKFSRVIAGRQVEKYVLLKRGQFAYNKGNSYQFPQGCIYQLTEYADGLVPDVFYSFELHQEHADPSFLRQYFITGLHNKHLYRWINTGVRNNGLLNLSSSDFFKLPIHLPELMEQRKIGEVLNLADDELWQLEAKLTALIARKKGLMQKLLTGQIRVKP